MPGFMGSTIAQGLPVGNSRGLKTQMPDKAGCSSGSGICGAGLGRVRRGGKPPEVSRELFAPLNQRRGDDPVPSDDGADRRRR